MLLEQVLTQWRCLVAFMKALDPLGDACGIVLQHCNDHRNGHHRCFVASGVALDMLHWVMPHVSLQRLTMAIKMACNGVAFVC